MLKIQRLFKIVLAGLLLISLTGCGTASNQTGTTVPSSSSSSAASVQTGSLIDKDQPNRVAEVYGKVKSIQGNIVLIAEMERSQSGATLTDAEKAKKKAQMQSLSEEERKKQLASQEVTTGKTLTITVPVGIPVKIKTTGSSDPTVEDGSISSIKAGGVINIWTESADPATAEYVSISNR